MIDKDIESNKYGKNLFSITFHVESLRLFAHIALNFILVIGVILTETLVDKLDNIPDPNETVIYETFGLNHGCNYIDHNPAKMVAGILIPLVQIPYMLYFFFYHKRVQKSVKDNEVPKWLLQYSSITTPFNIVVTSQLHMWFVNPPYDTYGFVAHYIPYFLFQTTLALQMILNVCYLESKKNLPWRISSLFAKLFVYWFVILTLVYTAGVIIVLSPSTAIDTKNVIGHQIALKVVTYVYGFIVLVFFIPVSAALRKDGDVVTLSLF